MNAVIKLTKSDIADIICEKYGVPMSYVIVRAEKQSVGHGPTEHDEYIPVAEVTMTRERMEEKGWI